ncbi:hypothetical protein M011DRAFT_412394 [Sporormia fimetaria CBS 119925]|uniref:F-box domain-containing protein n=1 Tax=Sporormia fimetaria CBS 119925 TaxID=1340428 RepID=A0A6A6UW99_9PLEO|nr:hypothetical protein M011DRAFT_412394 [Sporormia fimetaria CBS 119925]
MGLLDLPGELIDEIIDLTLPDGLEGFVLSCRAVHQRAAVQIKRHSRLKRLSRFAARPANDNGKCLFLLHELTRDPLLADYVRILNLRRPVEARSPSSLSEEFRMDDDTMERVKTMVMEAEWLEQAGIDVQELWEKMMEEDDADEDASSAPLPPFNTVALLSRLLALETLQLSNNWAELTQASFMTVPNDDLLVYMLEELVEYSVAHFGSRDALLGKLQVILPFMAAGQSQRAALQTVGPFLRLPSLKEFFGISLVAACDSFAGTPFEWHWKDDSALRRLELAHCCMNAEGFSAFLSHTPRLEVFKYSHETKWGGYLDDWNPGEFIVALAQACGSTIVELCLTVDDLSGEIINGGSSLLGFPKLKRIETDVLIFCGPPIESGQRRGPDPYVPPGDIPWTEHDIPCLGSMLPPSIVEVILNTEFPKADTVALRSLVKNFKQHKEERLFDLKDVCIRQYAGVSAGGLYGIHGLVRVVDGSENGRLRRPMLPLWKRDFAKRVGGIAYS